MYHITSFKDNGKFIVPQYSNYFLRCSQGKYNVVVVEGGNKLAIVQLVSK